MKNLTIFFSFFKSKFDLCLVASTEKGICNVLFSDTKKEGIADLQKRWPQAALINKRAPLHEKVEKYFNGKKLQGEIKFDVRGTEFQKKVWKELSKIKNGEIKTYGEIAKALGDRNLGRAVGSAIGKNPIGYLIPCHRVISTSGKISGYRWGVARKKAMLNVEKALKIYKKFAPACNSKGKCEILI